MAADYVDLAAEDGYPLVACTYRPKTAPRALVLFGSAMGVPQEFYAPLAAWLAEHGYLCVTFDYRGVGQSRRGPLRELEADIFDWARRDASAALAYARDCAPDAPVCWLGHSLGGQIVPLVRGAGEIVKVFNVASGIGYWRANPLRIRYGALLLWYVLVPALVPLFGYFPGKALRAVGDLPAGVIRQWRRWCLHPRYSVGAEGAEVEAEYAAFTAPIFSLHLTDDEMMSRRSIEGLNALYTGSESRIVAVAPADQGVKHIGHFGFFRASLGEPLWRQHLLVELTH